MAVSNGYQARLLFHAGVVRCLQAVGCEIIAATPRPLEEETVKELGRGVQVVSSSVVPGTPIARRYQNLRRVYLWPGKRTGTQEATRCKYLREMPFSTRFVEVVYKFLPWSAKLAIHRRMLQSRAARELLLRTKPDLVLMCSPGFIYMDGVLLNEATKQSIRTAAVGQSWDNFSSKGYVHPKPDLMLCWGQQMRRDAIELQGFDPSSTVICGVPHFDIYHDLGRLGDRAAVLRRLGLDPERKLIVYGTSAEMYSPNQFQIVSRLASWVNSDSPSGGLGTPCQLAVRLSPQDFVGSYASKNIDRYDTLAGPRVKIVRPLVRESTFDIYMRPGDQDLLALIMAQADVVGNHASTFGLDAIAAGKPTYCALFDGDDELPVERSSRRARDFHHVDQLLKSGGVRVASSFDEMRAAICSYLGDPELDAATRRRVVERFLYRVDGQSARRVSEAILQFLSGAGHAHSATR